MKVQIKDLVECDRQAWTSEFCDWSGTYEEAGDDDGGAIIYCPKCQWIIEWNTETK